MATTPPAQQLQNNPQQQLATASTSMQSRFRCRESVIVAADERLVRLDFTNSNPKVSLYAHPWALSSWSKVLNNVLEDASRRVADQHQQEEVCIPIDDADPTAWEEALSMIYPAVPLFAVTFTNAARLLQLADKYDMPCLTEHVRTFLGNNLESLLATEQAEHKPSTAFEWLQVSSRYQLQQQVQVCIRHIASRNLPPPAGLFSSIVAADAEQLMAAVQQQVTGLQQQITGLQAELAAAAAAAAFQPPPLNVVPVHHFQPLNPACNDAVLAYLNANNQDMGVHWQQIANALQNQFNHDQIRQSLQELTAEAYLYTTTDDDHYKAA